MKRRNFLKTTALGSALVITSPVVSLAVESSDRESPFVPPAFELEEMTIPQLQQSLTSGKHTSRSLVEKYVDRINDLDKKGPTLYSVIEL